ncbi:SDR family oxidoreductase [bacterium]|nr:SDR family oxidoreductase [bacterium]
MTPSNDTPTKTAFVTGASRGIGAAIAMRLARDGFVVGVGYRSGEDGAKAVCESVAAEGGRAMPVRVDVTDPESVKDAVAAFVKETGGLDAMVANAGVVENNMAVFTGEEALAAMVETNLSGAFRSAKAAIKPMMRRGGGRIVIISSVAGLMGNPGQAVYSATKAGVIGLAKALARELAPKGILVNVVAPGLIDTGDGGMIEGIPPEHRAAAESLIALGRAGKPEEVSGVVSFLCGADSTYLTGQVVTVDGGMRM